MTLLLGRAQYLAANVSEARSTYRSAADLAEQIGAAELLAEAALAVGVDYTFGVRDDLEIQLLESALRHLPRRHEALRARVLARLARALLFGSDLPYRMRLSEQAVALARRSEDTTALAAVLIDRHIAVWGFANAPERLEIATEIVRLAQASEDRGLLIQGHVLRLAYLLELVDIAGYDVEVDVYEQLVRDNRLAHLTWHVLLLRANQHFIAGRFSEAEELIEASLTTGRRVEQPSVEVWCAALFTSVKLWRGQAEQAIAWLRSQADDLPAVPAARSGVAVLLADSGQTAAARVEFERLAADDFGYLPRDETWLINMGALAATCHVLDDRPRAAVLYDLMLPTRRT